MLNSKLKLLAKFVSAYKVIISSLLGIFFVLVFFAFTNSKALAHLYAGTSVLDHLPRPVPGLKFPCDNVGDPEFHSLRPYQAAPCGDSNKALFCWNNYLLEEGVSTTWSPECTPNGGSYSCPPPSEDFDIEKIYVVDGEYARFPIMGNTEQVRNSQN